MRRALDWILGIAVGLASAVWWATSYRFNSWFEVSASGDCAASQIKTIGFSLPVMLLGIFVVVTLLIGRSRADHRAKDDGKLWKRTLRTVATCVIVLLVLAIVFEAWGWWVYTNTPHLWNLDCPLR
jgi:heme/copper-type cytochrome/quinol oxidase subunit 2